VEEMRGDRPAKRPTSYSPPPPPQTLPNRHRCGHGRDRKERKGDEDGTGWDGTATPETPQTFRAREEETPPYTGDVAGRCYSAGGGRKQQIRWRGQTCHFVLSVTPT
jgi:hypothetical protein